MTDSLPARRLPRLPKLSELSQDDQERVLKGVAFDALKDEMKRRQVAESSDVDSLIADFLKTRKSPQTARRYRNSIRIWRRWCESAGIEHLLLAEPKDADLFAAQLQGAPATVNSTISAVSSFYSTLSKWGKISRTPFVKVARRSEASAEHLVPISGEVKIMLANATGTLLVAMSAMAHRGFRVGALAPMTVTGSRFMTTSKGKPWKGELPRSVISVLKDRGEHPFATVKPGTVQAAFKRLTTRLAASGEIRHAYSVHDLRHYYATSQYKRTKDLALVSQLLNHADPATTMRYLHDLGAM